jgi:hypothetical protein
MKPEEVEEEEEDNGKSKNTDKKQNVKQGLKTGIQELMNNQQKKEDKDAIDKQQVDFMI